MATDKKSLEDKINAVNSDLSSKMDAFMAAIVAQITNRDRVLLRTPKTSGNMSTKMGGQGQQKKTFRSSFSVGNPKVELPAFKGEQLLELIRKAQKYFQLHHIPKEQRIEVAKF